MGAFIGKNTVKTKKASFSMGPKYIFSLLCAIELRDSQYHMFVSFDLNKYEKVKKMSHNMSHIT